MMFDGGAPTLNDSLICHSTIDDFVSIRSQNINLADSEINQAKPSQT